MVTGDNGYLKAVLLYKNFWDINIFSKNKS